MGLETGFYVFDGEVYCEHCLPADERDDENSEAACVPIFETEEWDNYPTCEDCGALCDRVSLTPPREDDLEVSTWFERDRKNVRVVDNRRGEDEEGYELLCIWDSQVDEMITDGFLNPWDIRGSVYKYLKSHGKVV